MAITLSALASCTYGTMSEKQCLEINLGPALGVVEQLTSKNIYRGGAVDVQHTMCSTHDNRLASASKALTLAGYRNDTRIAELGNCIDVTIASPLTSPELERQVRSLCSIAAGQRIAYIDISGSVDGWRFFVSGDYVSITAPGELPEALQPEGNPERSS